jgi:quinolinate synthase
MNTVRALLHPSRSPRTDLRATLRARLGHVVPEAEIELGLPLVEEILDLKSEHDAVVVAHNYQVPLITGAIADFTGDSLAMARFAANSRARVIVVCGVEFMAETAKLLCPEQLVLLPSRAAGCSLAESITAADVVGLRCRYPGVPVIAYVNTSAAVKAEVDMCCTSANAVQVTRSLASPRVILLPDLHLATHVAGQCPVEVIAWSGACEVHVRFSADDIRGYRRAVDAAVLAHPECPADVRAQASFVGSTSAMVEYLKVTRPRRAMLLTECSMADNVSVACPEITFLRPCNLCRHMKSITLQSVAAALRELEPATEVDPGIAARARLPIERMLAL